MSHKKQFAVAALCKRRSLLGLFLGGLLLTGCNSFGPANYVTPSVTGRVLAADTQQPLAGVTVSRVVAGQGVTTGAPAYGAELLSQGRPEITDAEGIFVLSGREYITLFRHAGWSSVRLTFQAPGYATFQTNYTAASFTNQTASDASVINVGEVLLKRR